MVRYAHMSERIAAMEMTAQQNMTNQVLWMFVLPKHLIEASSACAQATSQTRNAVVEKALHEYVRKMERERC